MEREECRIGQQVCLFNIHGEVQSGVIKSMDERKVELKVIDGNASRRYEEIFATYKDAAGKIVDTTARLQEIVCQCCGDNYCKDCRMNAIRNAGIEQKDTYKYYEHLQLSVADIIEDVEQKTRKECKEITKDIVNEIKYKYICYVAFLLIVIGVITWLNYLR